MSTEALWCRHQQTIRPTEDWICSMTGSSILMWRWALTRWITKTTQGQCLRAMERRMTCIRLRSQLTRAQSIWILSLPACCSYQIKWINRCQRQQRIETISYLARVPLLRTICSLRSFNRLTLPYTGMVDLKQSWKRTSICRTESLMQSSLHRNTLSLTRLSTYWTHLTSHRWCRQQRAKVLQLPLVTRFFTRWTNSRRSSSTAWVDCKSRGVILTIFYGGLPLVVQAWSNSIMRTSAKILSSWYLPGKRVHSRLLHGKVQTYLWIKTSQSS